MNAKGKALTAVLTGLIGLAAVAGPAHAAGIVMLPKAKGVNKTVSGLSRSKPGEYTAHAELQVVNWGPAENVSCSLWTNARESAGDTGWRPVSTDSVIVGAPVDFDNDIQLDAVIDSTRRFKVEVRCNHTGGAFGNRPYVEPGAFTVVFSNP